MRRRRMRPVTPGQVVKGDGEGSGLPAHGMPHGFIVAISFGPP